MLVGIWPIDISFFHYLVRQLPNALNLSPEKFKVLFGVEKPEESEEIVFFCLLGKRSFVAREIAKAVGYARCVVFPFEI